MTMHVSGFCSIRLPVRDIVRARDFYCDVVGFAPVTSMTAQEISIQAPDGPTLYLMTATESEFRHLHWQQWGELYAGFEIFVDDLPALCERLQSAGVRLNGEPFYRGDYLTLGFFDPDGHFLFAVDRHGRYFRLKSQFEDHLGRQLSPSEDRQLQSLGASTAEGDELAVLQTLLAELPGAASGERDESGGGMSAG